MQETGAGKKTPPYAGRCSEDLVSLLIDCREGIGENLRKVDMMLFCKCVEPSGDRQIFSYRFAPVLFRIGIHIQSKQTDESTGVPV